MLEDDTPLILTKYAQIRTCYMVLSPAMLLLLIARVGYDDVPGYDDDPAETWATPGRPPIADPYGHPLTLGAVLSAHDTLVSHASCGPAISGYGSDGEDFDGASCPCQWRADRGTRQRPPHGPGVARLRLRLVLGRELRVWICPRHSHPRLRPGP